jgi:hypothetical protein
MKTLILFLAFIGAVAAVNIYHEPVPDFALEHFFREHYGRELPRNMNNVFYTDSTKSLEQRVEHFQTARWNNVRNLNETHDQMIIRRMREERVRYRPSEPGCNLAQVQDLWSVWVETHIGALETESGDLTTLFSNGTLNKEPLVIFEASFNSTLFCDSNDRNSGGKANTGCDYYSTIQTNQTIPAFNLTLPGPIQVIPFVITGCKDNVPVVYTTPQELQGRGVLGNADNLYVEPKGGELIRHAPNPIARVALLQRVLGVQVTMGSYSSGFGVVSGPESGTDFNLYVREVSEDPDLVSLIIDNRFMGADPTTGLNTFIGRFRFKSTRAIPAGLI